MHNVVLQATVGELCLYAASVCAKIAAIGLEFCEYV